MFIKPEQIHDATLEELGAAYEQILFLEAEVEPEKQQIREELASRMSQTDMLLGNLSISKTRRHNYGKIDIAKAEELGAIVCKVKGYDKEKLVQYGIEHQVEVDTKTVEGLFKSGAITDIPFTESITIRELKED